MMKVVVLGWLLVVNVSGTYQVATGSKSLADLDQSQMNSYVDQSGAESRTVVFRTQPRAPPVLFTLPWSVLRSRRLQRVNETLSQKASNEARMLIASPTTTTKPYPVSRRNGLSSSGATICPKERRVYGSSSGYVRCDKGKSPALACLPPRKYNVATGECEQECLSADGTYSIPGECTKYKVCANYSATVKPCPEGLHYDAELKSCDEPQKAGCEITCNREDSLTYKPVTGKCDQYVACNNGTALLQHCAMHLHFNPLLRTCQEPEQAGCEPSCPSEDGFYPKYGQCDKYISCKAGSPQVHRCPGDAHFNKELKQCDDPTKAECEFTCPHIDGPGIFSFPYATSCTAFIQCKNGIAVIKKCPPRLHFNAILLTCDIPEEANCKYMCPHDVGSFPFPGDCRKFVICENGEPQYQQCPPGLHFNAAMETCDFPEHAQCNQKDKM